MRMPSTNRDQQGKAMKKTSLFEYLCRNVHVESRLVGSVVTCGLMVTPHGSFPLTLDHGEGTRPNVFDLSPHAR